jgi:hypothetical protein
MNVNPINKAKFKLKLFSFQQIPQLSTIKEHSLKCSIEKKNASPFPNRQKSNNLALCFDGHNVFANALIRKYKVDRKIQTNK